MLYSLMQFLWDFHDFGSDMFKYGVPYKTAIGVTVESKSSSFAF